MYKPDSSHFLSSTVFHRVFTGRLTYSFFIIIFKSDLNWDTQKNPVHLLSVLLVLTVT